MCHILFVLMRASPLLYKLTKPNTSSSPLCFWALRAKGRQKPIENIITDTKMIKLRSKRFCRGSFKFGGGGGSSNSKEAAARSGSYGGGITNNSTEIKWELRPGGMLVQKRETGESEGEGTITIRVSTVSQWHDISIEATSTFGELKMVLSLVSGLEPREQRLLFKGKEREDNEFLHMVGVRDKDKVLLLEDPAIKEMKLHGLRGRQPIGSTTAYRTISV